jgi:dolichol-phosphate mannosyltransferase
MIETGLLLSVVIPTRNEAKSLPVLVGRLEAALAGTEHELVIVDDSDDDTPGVIGRLAAELGEGRIRSLLRTGPERHGGLSTAVVAGLRLAQGRYVCVMDADLQHPPETIPAMLAAAEAGADVVVASRYMAGGSSGGLHGGMRRLVSRGATDLSRSVFWESRRSSDPLSGFFLCRRLLVDGIEFRPVGFKILLELLVLLPEVTVTDVPLHFEAREYDQSKATVGQGLLFLRHLRSLFFDVQGSARAVKYAIVGGSGLLVFLPLLWLLASVGNLPSLLAFLPAFAVSLAWNTTLNRLWTFADQRRRSAGFGLRRYLRWSLVSGGLMFACFAALAITGINVVVAGAVSAVVAMLANGFGNRREVALQPLAWARVATDRGVQAALVRLAQQLGADRTYVLPARVRGSGSTSVPAEVVASVVDRRRPVLWTEAPSHRPQRRTNIESTSTLLVPVVDDAEVIAVVVCERRAPRGFDAAALETATRAVAGIAEAIAMATGTVSGAAVRAAGSAS